MPRTTASKCDFSVVAKHLKAPSCQVPAVCPSVRQLKYDLTPPAGLALVGDHFKNVGPVLTLLDKTLPGPAGVANSDVLHNDPGPLVQSKSEFDTVENHQGEKFYKHALDIE